MKPIRVRKHLRRREPALYTPYTGLEARRAGLSSERDTRAWLRRTFPGDRFKDPTREEDEQWDIDVWWNDVPYSIKTQGKALETGNLSFELRKMDRNGQWQDSWFYRGQAKVYIVRFGKRVGIIHKDAFVRFIQAHGFERTTRNSEAIVRREMASGNPFVNAESGLIGIKRLEAEELITYLPNDLPAVMD